MVSGSIVGYFRFRDARHTYRLVLAAGDRQPTVVVAAHTTGEVLVLLPVLGIHQAATLELHKEGSDTTLTQCRACGFVGGHRYVGK